MPSETSEPPGPGSIQLEGAACATATVGGPTAPSLPDGETQRFSPPFENQTVYALELAGRNLYCSSPCCVSKLLAQGWRLSDASQLAALVRVLATGRAAPTHDPSDHFK